MMNELDALVNIDFVSRTVRPAEERMSLRIIRLGTSGSLQARRARWSDAGHRARRGPRQPHAVLPADGNRPGNRNSHRIAANRWGCPTRPTWCGAPTWLREQLGAGMVMGNTLTCPGFYGPQGRRLRLDLRQPDYMARLQSF
ncbi:MAG: hypothetical protein WKG07_33710 [Hymenobacter sp.]